jgi:hypothetical protein
MFGVLLIGSSQVAEAQTPVFPTDYANEGDLYVYFDLNGHNVKSALTEATAIEIDMEDPMIMTLDIVWDGTNDVNMSGSIVFYYLGIPLFPIQIVEPVTNSTWIWVEANSTIDTIVASLDFAQVFSFSGIKAVTGVLQASIDFQFIEDGDTTVQTLSEGFFFEIPSGPADIFTSVSGITATAATVGAVYGIGTGLQSIIDGLKTAYKLRGIHKKASEIKSLPNMTVLGALPLLFSMLIGMGKMKKKKSKKDEEGRDDSGVSEYMVRQRLRETAPDAWPADKCPQCKRKWDTKTDTCKKCKIGPDEARTAYADLLASKVPKALEVMGKKKSTDIRTLAKKTKSTDYNAGVIAAAMVDTNVTEIVKVGTPLRSFVMNIAGLAFLVITWQQLLGDSASTFQTTITVVGAALSLAVIVALYVSRKSQIEKFEAEMAETEPPAPEAEASEESEEPTTSEEEESPEGQTSDAEQDEPDDLPRESTVASEESEEPTTSEEEESLEDQTSDAELDEPDDVPEESEIASEEPDDSEE